MKTAMVFNAGAGLALIGYLLIWQDEELLAVAIGLIGAAQAWSFK